MSDNRFRCPNPACGKSLGGLTAEGDVRVRLAITLVKADGSVHGPCSHCGSDVVLTKDGSVVDTVRKALSTEPETRRGRFVLNLRDLGS